MSEIIANDKEYVAGTYARFPVEIVKGKGSEVFDADGKRYIDMGSGIGVTAFGISDDIWARAVTERLSAVLYLHLQRSAHRLSHYLRCLFFLRQTDRPHLFKDCAGISWLYVVLLPWPDPVLPVPLRTL